MPGFQTWTVPASGRYKIWLYGAGNQLAGTFGASLVSVFELMVGSKLHIVIGQCGDTKYAGCGGSFVALAVDDAGHKPTPLVIAGGAAGAERPNRFSNASGSKYGHMSDTIRKNNIKYGDGGNGYNGAGGGAGFFTNGAGSKFKNAKTFKKGLVGGFGRDGFLYTGKRQPGHDGGFGGGGAGIGGMGGGGGYTGGHGGTSLAGGGGSLSMDGLAHVSIDNISSGRCIITKL